MVIGDGRGVATALQVGGMPIFVPVGVAVEPPCIDVQQSRQPLPCLEHQPPCAVFAELA